MGLIPEDVISEIRSRTDIVAVISQHIQLRKAGRNHKGLCPFHGEKTASFNVNGDKGFFYCFGCQKKGDVFTFVMEYEGKSFLEAAESLAELAGVTITREAEPAAVKQQRTERARMLELNKLAAAFFVETLRDPRRGEPGRRYLAERGIGDEVAARFQLGYAPADWHALADELARRNAPMDLAVKVGLVARQPRAGGFYDRFRARLVCPVVMPGGDVVGFSARAIGEGEGEEAGAKYINSPESPVYKKSRLLFGLHQARDAFRRAGRALLVEGNFDVVTLHQGGFTETVAPLGTALTDEQVEQLRRLADEVVLFYDGDKAGRAATLKALEALVAADLPVRIASLPPGEDPDSLVKGRGPEALADLLARAQPAVEYFIHEVWVQGGTSADGRARALDEAGRVFRNVANPTKRGLIVDTFVAAMRVDPRLVRRALAQGAATSPGGHGAGEPAAAAPRTPADAPPPSDEVELLAILADHPSLITTAEQYEAFSLLTDERLRDMYSAAREGLPVLAAAPDDLSPLIAQKVLAGSFAAVTDPAHTLTGILTRLQHRQMRGRLADLKQAQSDAWRRGDAEQARALSLEILETRKRL